MSIEQAKQSVIQEANRIRDERRILEDRLQELRASVHAGVKPMRGFNLHNIEKEAAASAEIYARIDSIEGALKKDFFDDPAFCRSALVYLQKIENEVQQLDRKKVQIGEKLDKLKRELEEATELAERERSEITSQLATLFEPLNASVYADNGCTYSGAYILRKLRILAEKGA